MLQIPNVDLHKFFSNSHRDTHRLEYLHISTLYHWQDIETSSSHTSSSNESSSGTFTLSDNVLHIDSLRHLRIDRCGLDFHAAFLHSLTHLELFNINEDCRLPCSDFVAVLATIPALEILHFSSGSLDDEVDDVEEYVASKIRLHRLKYLRLSCPTGEMAQFLCSLILPPSCKLRLRFFLDDDAAIAVSFPLICSWLSRHFQPPPSSPPSYEGEESFQNYFRSFLIDNIVGEPAVTGFYELEIPHLWEREERALLSISLLNL